MRKGIYTYYKERLIEIGGNNKCLYLKSIGRKGAYDIGRILEGRGDKVAEFLEFLWTTRRFPLTIIGNKEKKQIIENLDIQSKLDKRRLDTTSLTGEELLKASQKNERIRREESNKAVEAEITKIKEIKRDVEEIEKETGRYELYIGYPFVFGTINQGPTKTTIKAPLLLFPVKIDIPDENTVEISINEREKIQLNRALIFAYAQSKKLNIDLMETEFDDLSQFPTIGAVVKYLESFHIKFDGSEYESKNIYNYARFKEPDGKPSLSLRYAAVLTRYSLSNSIFNDYTALEKKHLTNDAISELLRMGKPKKKALFKKKQVKRTPQNSYTVKMLDYAQSEVVRRVDECGNMVIYGPPGTGKSQTIVNIISDAMSKKKRVLVISQKKAALDVVYNRLGPLNEKAMYITDETKEKKSFYDKCLDAHQKDMIAALVDVNKLQASYNELQEKIDAETAKLDNIYHVLNDKRPFGLSLSEMYSSSTMLQKNSIDYGIYTKLIEHPEIMALTYKELSEALMDIKAKNLEELYYNYLQEKEKNPIIDYLLPDVDTNTLCEVRGALVEIQKSRKGLFNTAKYPFYRQVLAYYYELESEAGLDAVVKLARKFSSEKSDAIREKLIETRNVINAAAKEYECLHRVLTPEGYLAVIDNILRGNTSYIRHVSDALNNYIDLRDVSNLLDSLDKNKTLILNFAYTISRNNQNYAEILSKLLEIRIYHEAARYEDECKEELSKIVDFQNITSRISRYKQAQLEASIKLCEGKASRDYETLYESAPNNKDYLYQISKKQKFWPIRKTMEVYGEFVLTLFPCWLLSPENVSNLLPLTKNLFDLVIFDEASQVFIESTIPSIYRGKNIVVAGDAKQLRPSTTFMKRYLGGDPESQEDYSVQAALEVESLLDLAVSRYTSANLTYHYRSKNQELIDFSNHAFYGMTLQIAPNISRNSKSRPIERYKVNGKWIDRKNTAEAKKVVEVLKNIFNTRKNDESIGIITFNADQQSCIADMIDRECSKDHDFRSHILKEKIRMDNGEDTSIFIKNLENVQGDERDIIIFSIGYAENELGRIYTNFGSLSAEGGENRLNVAITRAKTKIIVVTSIEPEDLKVDTAKHVGPKLLRKYLTYVRAVSKGDDEEVKAILADIESSEQQASSYANLISVEHQIKDRLEKLGYKVDVNLGNSNSRISLAVYDSDTDRYLVGVELDRDAFASSESCIERDVCKPLFLESRGWSIIRIWSRDWWASPTKVIRTITNEAEKNKKKKA
ncbi:MAG: DUF4011 domain-containing protein [Clostridia bacterium]|nr:DUF4011 domain-containing protein [Clostridia bacterium]